MDFSGWEIGFHIGWVLLAVAIAYGLIQSRRAGRGSDARGEAGARAVYDDAGDRDASPDDGSKKTVPPLVWIIVGLLVAWLVIAAAMSRNTLSTPSGGEAHRAVEGETVMPATPATPEAPGTPGQVIPPAT
ncbi:MAG TPA: hypothetical protein VEA79_00705 [Phenylobacterium sp.]|nr:hypothetical protein [Phenylobacterium sp.]